MNLQINSAEVQPQTPDLDGGGIQAVTTQSLFHLIYSHQTFVNIHNAKHVLSNTINAQTTAFSQSSIYP
jgi:hypothetical protein